MVRFRTLTLVFINSPQASAVAQTGAVVPLVKFIFGVRHGTRTEEAAPNSLDALTKLQIEAIRDATYIGWTEESLRIYEERWNLIAAIHAKLRYAESSFSPEQEREEE